MPQEEVTELDRLIEVIADVDMNVNDAVHEIAAVREAVDRLTHLTTVTMYAAAGTGAAVIGALLGLFLSWLL